MDGVVFWTDTLRPAPLGRAYPSRTALADLGGQRLDVPVGHQGLPCQKGTDHLVDQHREEGDVADQSALFSKLHSGCAHSQRYTCLRQQGDPQIFTDLRSAFHIFGTGKGADIFAGRAEQDVDQTNAHDGPIRKDTQLQLR